MTNNLAAQTRTDQVGIALVAHDPMKLELMSWARRHRHSLKPHRLYATATTGAELKRHLGLAVHCFNSGPLGGDQEIGGAIARGEIQILIFFFDPLGVHPHEADVRALLRIAVLSNVVVACNKSTAERIFSDFTLEQLPSLTANMPSDDWSFSQAAG